MTDGTNNAAYEFFRFFEPNQEWKAFSFEWSDDHFSSRLSNRPMNSSALPASNSPLSKTLPIFLPKISCP